jgi:hypothetical protein
MSRPSSCRTKAKWAGAKTPQPSYLPYSPKYLEVWNSPKLGMLFPLEPLMSSAVGQPLGKQFLRPLRPRGRFIS